MNLDRVPEDDPDILTFPGYVASVDGVESVLFERHWDQRT
jgi:hypothetical protein